MYIYILWHTKIDLTLVNKLHGATH